MTASPWRQDPRRPLCTEKSRFCQQRLSRQLGEQTQYGIYPVIRTFLGTHVLDYDSSQYEKEGRMGSTYLHRWIALVSRA